MPFIEISTLTSGQIKKLKSFTTCTKHNELKEHLSKFALQHSKKGLYKTYIYYDLKTKEYIEAEEHIYQAYISFANVTTEDESGELKSALSVSGAMQYPIPSLKITRLCTFDKYEKKGIGAKCIKLAVLLAFIQQQITGCRLIVLDAKEDAVLWYKTKMKFEQSENYEDEGISTFFMYHAIPTLVELKDVEGEDYREAFLQELIEFSEEEKLEREKASLQYILESIQ